MQSGAPGLGAPCEGTSAFQAASEPEVEMVDMAAGFCVGCRNAAEITSGINRENVKLLLVRLTFLLERLWMKYCLCLHIVDKKKYKVYRTWFFYLWRMLWENDLIIQNKTCPLPRAATWHSHFQLSSRAWRQSSAVDGCDSHVSACDWVTSISKRARGGAVQLTQIETQQSSCESRPAETPRTTASGTTK